MYHWPAFFTLGYLFGSSNLLSHIASRSLPRQARFDPASPVRHHNPSARPGKPSPLRTRNPSVRPGKSSPVRRRSPSARPGKSNPVPLHNPSVRPDKSGSASALPPSGSGARPARLVQTLTVPSVSSSNIRHLPPRLQLWLWLAGSVQLSMAACSTLEHMRKHSGRGYSRFRFEHRLI